MTVQGPEQTFDCRTQGLRAIHHHQVAPPPGQPEPRAGRWLRKSALGTQLAYLVILRHISASFRGLLLRLFVFDNSQALQPEKKRVEQVAEKRRPACDLRHNLVDRVL